MAVLSSEQQEFRRAVARFVDAEVVPRAQAMDESGEFPWELFRRLGELGYLGLRYPERYGGSGADMVTFCLLAEELGRGSMSLAASAMMQALMGTHFIYAHGTEAQRERYLIPALRGERVHTFALTEPGAGSDLGAMATTARRDGDHWVLRGTKTWVTSAPIADVLTVSAKTSAERGLKSIALFLVDRREAPGLALSRKIEKVAVRASDTGEIVLDDVRVPADHCLGGETGGVEKVGGILAEIRVMTAALSLGLARAAYGEALRYARERVAFGKAIVEHQAVGFKLAEMLAQIHASSVLTYDTAAAVDRGGPVAREAAIAKLVASEMAVKVADEAARIFASYSLATEYPVQRYLRDSRFLLFGGGTSEILKLIIARDLDLERPASGS